MSLSYFYLLIAIYFGYLLLWGIINFFIWSVSVISRKNMMGIISGVSALSNMVLGFVIFIFTVYVFISLVRSGQIVWAVLLIMFDGVIASTFSILITPFTLLTAYLTSSVEQQLKERHGEYVEEIISPEGKVVKTIKSNQLVNRNLAIYFMSSYLVYLFGQLLVKRPQFEKWQITDYLWNPVSELFLWALIIGVVIASYNFVRFRKLLPNGFRDLLANSYKVITIILTAVLVFFFVRYVLL